MGHCDSNRLPTRLDTASRNSADESQNPESLPSMFNSGKKAGTDIRSSRTVSSSHATMSRYNPETNKMETVELTQQEEEELEKEIEEEIKEMEGVFEGLMPLIFGGISSLGESIFSTDLSQQIPTQANVKIEEINQPKGKSQLDQARIIEPSSVVEIGKKENPVLTRLVESQVKSENPSIIKPSNNRESEKLVKSSKGYTQLFFILLMGVALIGGIYYYYNSKPRSTSRGDGHHSELKSMKFRENDDFKNL